MERTTNKRLLKIVTIGLMSALVYLGNYLSIPIPNGMLVTRIHLGNSMCLLAGLLFCGTTGGLASGIGGALYDLFQPAYIMSSPFTFVSKFVMGFIAGKLNRADQEGKIPLKTTIIAAVLGQAAYIILYLIKSFFTIIILGGTVEAAWTAVGTNAISSSINAVISVVISVPLYVALKKALVRTPVKPLINEKSASKGYFNPLTAGLTAFAFLAVTVFTLNLSAQTKLENQQAEEKAALEKRIEEYEDKLDYLYGELNIEMPEAEEN